LAKEYHPDVNSGNETKFKEINEAYNVLSQDKLKKLYDANREKGEDESFNEDSSLGDKEARKRNLNYEPYSQMSKAQWAVYRNGYMPFNRTDYTNYK
jgi:DnaJ-class molecular chaperone